MSCTNDCRQPAAFPKTIDNRPGLSTIDYRIGSYADLREHMLSRLDESTVLAEWTHRLPDDPGIALIEAAAEVGDILSFYQDLYANEAYLRSAKWRDSVAFVCGKWAASSPAVMSRSRRSCSIFRRVGSDNAWYTRFMAPISIFS